MGIRKELLSTAPGKELICGRCHDILDQPKSLPCGHYFCTECVDGKSPASQASPLTSASSVKSRRSARRLHICPQCDEPITTNTIDPPPPVPAWVNVKLTGLTFATCPLGCGQRDMLVVEFPMHQIRACPNASQPCPNQELGCKDKVTRQTVEAHLENCLYRKVKCPVCHLETTQADLFPHQIKRRCAERATKLEITRTMRNCHRELANHNKELLDHRNTSLQTTREVTVDHLTKMGIKGFIKLDENTTPMGTPRNPRFYEALPTCQRCEKYYNEECNHMSSCCWHAGVGCCRYLARL